MDGICSSLRCSKRPCKPARAAARGSKSGLRRCPAKGRPVVSMARLAGL